MNDKAAKVYVSVDDEDVWLFCDGCDWRKSFGPFSELGPLIRAEQRHRKECHRPQEAVTLRPWR